MVGARRRAAVGWKPSVADVADDRQHRLGEMRSRREEKRREEKRRCHKGRKGPHRRRGKSTPPPPPRARRRCCLVVIVLRLPPEHRPPSISNSQTQHCGFEFDCSSPLGACRNAQSYRVCDDNRSQWSWRIDDLDFHIYLPIFCDGLREVDDPYRFLAVQGVIDMIEVTSVLPWWPATHHRHRPSPRSPPSPHRQRSHRHHHFHRCHQSSPSPSPSL